MKGQRFTKEEMLREYDMVDFALSPYCKTENRGYFTNSRVNRSTLPEGWHAYDIMGTDSGCIGNGIIKEYVRVNHVGTFVTQKPLKMTHLMRRDDGTLIDAYRGVGSYSFMDPDE